MHILGMGLSGHGGMIQLFATCVTLLLYYPGAWFTFQLKTAISHFLVFLYDQNIISESKQAI